MKYIRCLGVDNKWHICRPESDTCKCGVKVKTKKEKEIKALKNKEIYFCYECTY